MAKLIFPLSRKEAEKAKIKYSSEDNKNAVFPSRLREQRQKLDISQSALAKLLGVTKSTIGLYETGDNVPDVKTLAKMTKCFGVSADYLIGGVEDPTTDIEDKAIIEKTGLSSEAISTLKLHRLLDKAGKVGWVSRIDVVNYLLENITYHTNDLSKVSIIDMISNYFCLMNENSKSYIMNAVGGIRKHESKSHNVSDTVISTSQMERILLGEISDALRDMKKTYNLPHSKLPPLEKEARNNGNVKKEDA